jgi:hypothetical protein
MASARNLNIVIYLMAIINKPMELDMINFVLEVDRKHYKQFNVHIVYALVIANMTTMQNLEINFDELSIVV